MHHSTEYSQSTIDFLKCNCWEPFKGGVFGAFYVSMPNTLISLEFYVFANSPGPAYIYQLESSTILNNLTPDTADDFSATSQGRNIGVSAIVAINATDFLILERDNRGLGIEETQTPIHKRIYRISLRDDTDVQDISLANSDDLPSGVIPVSKEPFIDVLAQLTRTDRARETRRSRYWPAPR